MERFQKKQQMTLNKLLITLKKCKTTLANDIGDVALRGIQEYEQSLHVNDSDNVQNQNALNLNVSMNLSPVKVTSNDHSINENNPESTCYFEADEKNNIKVSKIKIRDRHTKTKSRKHSRNHKRKRRKHAEQISSSSSESGNTSEDSSSTSSSDDQERGKKSKRTRKKYLKLKEKLQHYRVRDQFKQADGPMTTTRDHSLRRIRNVLTILVAQK